MLGDAVHLRGSEPVAGQKGIRTKLVVLLHRLKYCFASDSESATTRNRTNASDIEHSGSAWPGGP